MTSEKDKDQTADQAEAPARKGPTRRYKHPAGDAVIHHSSGAKFAVKGGVVALPDDVAAELGLEAFEEPAKK